MGKEEGERAHRWQLLGEMKVSLKKKKCIWHATCRQKGEEKRSSDWQEEPPEPKPRSPAALGVCWKGWLGHE